MNTNILTNTYICIYFKPSAAEIYEIYIFWYLQVNGLPAALKGFQKDFVFYLFMANKAIKSCNTQTKKYGNIVYFFVV